MSKNALKALENIRRLLIREYQHLVDIVEEALTPPTKEEVCRALSDCFGLDIIYSGGEFIPKIPEDYYFYIVTVVDNGIVFTDALPPHLVTLVGKFYEGFNE